MNIDSNIQIRPATMVDKEFIISLVPRRVEFDPPAWRDVDKMTAANTQILSDKLINPRLRIRKRGSSTNLVEDNKIGKCLQSKFSICCWIFGDDCNSNSYLLIAREFFKIKSSAIAS